MLKGQAMIKKRQKNAEPIRIESDPHSGRLNPLFKKPGSGKSGRGEILYKGIAAIGLAMQRRQNGFYSKQEGVFTCSLRDFQL